MEDIQKKRFLGLSTRQELATLLQMSEASLRFFIYGKKTEKQYHTFYLSKRNGGKRRIDAPNIELRNVQKKLVKLLSLIYLKKKCVFGFVEGSDFIRNANQHVGRSIIFNIDLQDFFSQVNFGRVRGVLIAPPYNICPEIATMIAKLVCYEGTLPQGAPTSPILTNFVCRALDNSLTTFARETHCFYSRYADDITLSASSKTAVSQIFVFEDGIIRLSKRLSELFAENGFIVNEEKKSISYRFQRQEVTGLVVNKKVNIKREYLRKIRVLLHSCLIKGVYATAKIYIGKGLTHNQKIRDAIRDEANREFVENWFILVLIGKMHFIRQVRGEKDLLFQSYAMTMNLIIGRSYFSVKELLYVRANFDKNLFLIQTADTCRQGSGYYLEGYGIITSYHLVEKYDTFSVYTVTGKHLDIETNILLGTNDVFSDKELDYVIFQYQSTQPCLKIGDSRSLKRGDKVITLGFPMYALGNSYDRQICDITSQITYLKAPLYTVNGVVRHGYSGGMVLNMENEIIGLVKAGANFGDEENVLQGFIPIHFILESIEKQKLDRNATC